MWYHATIVDTLQDQGDCLVSFTYYLNEAVVGRLEMVELESINEIPCDEEVDVVALELLQPCEDVNPDKVEEENNGTVLLTKPKVGEQCVARWSDLVWYRGSVEELQEDGAVVLFIDHGNSDFVAWDLIELDASGIPPGAARDPNLAPEKSLAFADCTLMSLRMRLEIVKPLSVAVVESSGDFLVLTKCEVRLYSRQAVFISCFCSHLDQPTDLLLLKSGQVGQILLLYHLLKGIKDLSKHPPPPIYICFKVVVREARGLRLYSPDGQFLRTLGSQTDSSAGLAEDKNGMLITINCNMGMEKVKVTEAGETNIFFIDLEKDTVLKRIEMKYLTEEDDDAVKNKMKLTHLHNHEEHLLVVDEGNHRVFLFHQEDGEDVVEILPAEGIGSDFEFKVLSLCCFLLELLCRWWLIVTETIWYWTGLKSTSYLY